MLILIVNYNSWAATKRMLISANILRIKPNIYVLDNNSEIDTEEDAVDLKKLYRGNSYLIKLDRNYGYFGAVSEFLSRRKDLAFDWLFIANNDLIFNDSCLFDHLDECTRRWSDVVGAYCPAVISNRTMLDQNPFLRSKPGLAYYYKYKIITSSFYLAKMYALLARLKAKMRTLAAGRKRKVQAKPRTIFAAHGAFIGLSRLFFLRGGFIEHRNFLFHEEEILAIICDRIGLKIIYDPRVKILHYQHVTLGAAYTRFKHVTRKSSLNVFKQYL